MAIISKHTKFGWMAVLVPVLAFSIEAFAQSAADVQHAFTRYSELINAGKYVEAEPFAKQMVLGFEKLQGPNHNDTAWALTRLAEIYRHLNNYTESIPINERLVRYYEMQSEAHDLPLAVTLIDLAEAYFELGRYSHAESMHSRALLILEKLPDMDSSIIASVIRGLAKDNRYLGLLKTSVQLYRRALAIQEANGNTRGTEIARTLTGLAAALKDSSQGSEAEKLLLRALEIYERDEGPQSSDVALALSNLAGLYLDSEKAEEAEAVARRALSIIETTTLAQGRKVTNPYPFLNLAGALTLRKKHEEALIYFERGLNIMEEKVGPQHPSLAPFLAAYGTANFRAFEFQPYLPIGNILTPLKRALEIREKILGASHPLVAESLVDLSEFYIHMTWHKEARSSLERALTIFNETIGKNHPKTVLTLSSLAKAHFATKDYEQAIQFLRRAAAAAGAAGGPIERRVFYNLAVIAHSLSETRPDLREFLGDEAFQAAERAVSQTTGAALAQMAARSSRKNSVLVGRLRERQDLANLKQELDKQLITAVSALPDKRDEALLGRLRQDIKAAESKVSAIDSQLIIDFPEFAELSIPKPLNIVDTQDLLGADEALVTFVSDLSTSGSYVWAVTHKGVSWQRAEVSGKAVTEKLATLRRGLDRKACRAARGLARADELDAGCASAEALPFDLDIAYDLYKALLGPVESVIKDKKHLIIVPSGPLTSLPFDVLVTDKPSAPRDYPNAKWLAKRHAITVLPAVSSLRALRTFANGTRGAELYIGIGDPMFQRGSSSAKPNIAPPGSAAADAGIVVPGMTVVDGFGGRRPNATEQIVSRRTADISSRGFADYFRGPEADLDLLERGLAPLPGTSIELKAVARTLGAKGSDVITGREASETTVKRMSEEARLSRYRVVHFATHALVAGEIKGLAEPALALSLPATPSENDDGLLTASEVAGLKLNADWVVLSACNTAAGDKPGAEALSGLAKAFFYAGARALLVSHWPVEDQAGALLVTRTFKELAEHPEIGRSEALRRAQLALMQQSPHPALWAPYMVVGEGGAGQR